MSVATFYLDGSDLSPTDSDSAWDNEANIADGNTVTYAENTNSSGFAGEPANNAILCHGTNASGSGDISQVRVRLHNGSDWSSYVTLNSPVAGWSWEAVARLETFTEFGNMDPGVSTFIYEDGDLEGTILGVPTVEMADSRGRISKVEFEVTYTSDSTPTVGVKYPLPAFKRP